MRTATVSGLVLGISLSIVSTTALAGGDQCRRDEAAARTRVVGAELSAFEPNHVSGADAGKTTCPMCRYGDKNGVLVWINGDPSEGLSRLALQLEQEMTTRAADGFRAFLIFTNPSREAGSAYAARLKRWAESTRLSKVAVSWVARPDDPKTAGLYGIDPFATNAITGIAYRNRRSAGRIDKLPAGEAGALQLVALLGGTKTAGR